MGDSIPTEIDFERDFCAKHLEPLQRLWPIGAAPFALLTFTAFTNRADVQRYCGRDDSAGQLGNMHRMPAAMREFGPMCCTVGDTMMAEIAEAAIAGGGDAKALHARIQAEGSEMTVNPPEPPPG